MNFFKNAWFIGIVTGILSGLFVFLITNVVFENKRKREYSLNVQEANKEIINNLKSYIAEQGIPSFNVIKALISSTSRKYDVSANDLLTPIQICEDLIREIMADVYVSSDKKREYTDKVVEFKNGVLDKPSNIIDARINEKALNYKYEFIEKHIRVLCILLSGLMLLTLIIFIFDPNTALKIWAFPFEVNTENSILYMYEKASFVITLFITLLTMFLAMKFKHPHSFRDINETIDLDEMVKADSIPEDEMIVDKTEKGNKKLT